MLEFLSEKQISLDKVLLLFVLFVVILYYYNKNNHKNNHNKHKTDVSKNVLEKYENILHNNIIIRDEIDELDKLKPEEQVREMMVVIKNINSIKKKLLYGLEPLLNKKTYDLFIELVKNNLSKLSGKNAELLLGTELYNKNKLFLDELSEFFNKHYDSRIRYYNKIHDEYQNKLHDNSISVYNETKSEKNESKSEKNETKSETKNEKSGNNWKCVGDVTTPVRFNGTEYCFRGDKCIKSIECMSENGKDCMWSKTTEDCNNLLKKVPSKLVPHECHMDNYKDASHWCNKSAKYL